MRQQDTLPPARAMTTCAKRSWIFSKVSSVGGAMQARGQRPLPCSVASGAEWFPERGRPSEQSGRGTSTRRCARASGLALGDVGGRLPVLLRRRNDRRPPSRAPGRSCDGAHRSSYGRALGRSREGTRRRPKNRSLDDGLGVSRRTSEGRLPATYTATDPPRRAGIDSCRGADLWRRAVGRSAPAAPSAPGRVPIPTGAQCSGLAPLTVLRDRSAGPRSRRGVAGCANLSGPGLRSSAVSNRSQLWVLKQLELS